MKARKRAGVWQRPDRWAWLVLALAVVARLGLAHTKCLNHLEFTYILVPFTSGEVWHLLRHPIAVQQGHFPLHHLILYGIDQVSSAPLAFRAPSVLFAAVSLLGTYQLGALLADRRTALLATCMAAVSGSMLMYGADASCYALTVALAVWLIVALFRVLSAPRCGVGWPLALGLLAAASFWTSAFMGLYLLGLGGVLIGLCVAFRRDARTVAVALRALRALARGCLLALPLCTLVFTTHRVSRGFLGQDAALYWPTWRVVEFPYDWLRFSFGLFPVMGVAVIAVLALLVFGLRGLWKERRVAAALAVGLLLLPLTSEAVHTFMGSFRTAGYVPYMRHHLAVAPLLFVLAVMALQQRPRVARILLAMVGAAQIASAGLLVREQQRDPLGDAVALFQEQVQPGDTFATLPYFHVAAANFLLTEGEQGEWLQWPRWWDSGFYGPLDAFSRWIDHEGVSLFCDRLAVAVVRERLLGRPYFNETFPDEQLEAIGRDHELLQTHDLPDGELRYYRLNHRTDRVGADGLRLDGNHQRLYSSSPFYQGPYPLHAMTGLLGVHRFVVPTDLPSSPHRVTVGLGPRTGVCRHEPQVRWTCADETVIEHEVSDDHLSAVLPPPGGELLRFELTFEEAPDHFCWDFTGVEVQPVEVHDEARLDDVVP